MRNRAILKRQGKADVIWSWLEVFCIDINYIQYVWYLISIYVSVYTCLVWIEILQFQISTSVIRGYCKTSNFCNFLTFLCFKLNFKPMTSSCMVSWQLTVHIHVCVRAYRGRGGEGRDQIWFFSTQSINSSLTVFLLHFKLLVAIATLALVWPPRCLPRKIVALGQMLLITQWLATASL